MSRVSKALVVLCLLAVALCQDYDLQDQWGGDCQTGKRQSPININSRYVQGCESQATFDLSAKDELYTQIAYNPHNENLKTPFTLSTINITKYGASKIFNAIQFHLHHRSEHHLNKREYDLELHIVHQAEDKSLAVFGILFEARNGKFSDPFDNWHLDTAVPLQQKFPIKLTTPDKVYHYQGSLTTPDCTEGVQWFVSEDIIKIKKSSLHKIAELINEGHNNNRKIQGVNGRQVFESGAVCSIHKKGKHHLLNLQRDF